MSSVACGNFGQSGVIMAFSALRGGLNYTFLEKSDSEDSLSKYTCAICRLVSRELQQVTCCGHIYCHGCLVNLKEVSPNFKCPTCAHPLAEGDYFPDKRAKLNINSLRIHCPNNTTQSKRGCNWEGELLNIDSHLKQSCSLQLVPLY